MSDSLRIELDQGVVNTLNYPKTLTFGGVRRALRSLPFGAEETIAWWGKLPQM